MDLFNDVRMLILGSSDHKEISIWDYENLKLLTIIKLNSPIISMKFDPVYKILMTSNLND